MLEKQISRDKRDSFRIGEDYGFLDRLLDSGDSVDLARLDRAVEANSISRKEHAVLARKLLKRHEQVEEGLVGATKQLENKVEGLGIDPVTKLFKRDSLEQKLSNLIKELKKPILEQRRQPPFGSVMIVAIDLDNLKKWNSKGRLVGDKALLALADSVKRVIRDTDCAFRLGERSDEIIVILRFDKELDPDQLREKFEDIKTSINSGYIEVNGEKLPVTAAAGYEMLKTGESRNIEEILEAVDKNQLADKKEEVKISRIERAKANLN